MKRVIFVISALFVFAVPVYAQDDPTTSGSLAELINQSGALITVVVLAFFGMISTRLTAFITGLSIFSEGDKSTISGISADIVSGLSALAVSGIGFGVAYLTGLLDDPDIITMAGGWITTWLGSNLHYNFFGKKKAEVK